MPTIVPVLVVAFPESKGEIAFATTEEFDAWMKQQEEFYAWIFSVGSSHSSIAALRGQWKQFRNLVATARGQLNNAPSDQATVEKTKSDIEAAMRGSPAIVLSDSAEARFLRKSMAGNPRTVAYALANLRSAPTNDEAAENIVGTVLAYEYRKGTAEATTEQRIQLEDLIARASVDLAGRTAEWAFLANNVNATNKSALDSREKFEKESIEWVKTKNSELETFQSKWETEFGNARTAYNVELGLQAPVTYWTSKRKHHARKAAALARWLALSFVLFFAVIAWAAAVLLDVEVAKASQLRLWHLTILTVMILAAVWGLRILVRLFFGNSHLENDAHERITIANTYLALLRRGKVTELEQKALFDALMRHSTDGIVQDDAMPHGVGSLLRRP